MLPSTTSRVAFGLFCIERNEEVNATSNMLPLTNTLSKNTNYTVLSPHRRSPDHIINKHALYYIHPMGSGVRLYIVELLIVVELSIHPHYMYGNPKSCTRPGILEEHNRGRFLFLSTFSFRQLFHTNFTL